MAIQSSKRDSSTTKSINQHSHAGSVSTQQFISAFPATLPLQIRAAEDLLILHVHHSEKEDGLATGETSDAPSGEPML